MKYPPPLEARTAFVDGPISVFIHQAPEAEILEAFARLSRLVPVAARLLEAEPHPHFTLPAGPFA